MNELNIPADLHISDMLHPAKTTTLSMLVAIPAWARFLAMDPAGSVCAFAERPVAGEHCWESPIDPHRKLMVAEATYWWVDKCSAPNVYADWRMMICEVQP